MSSGDTSAPNYRETTKRFWIVQLITEVHPDGMYIRLAPFQRSFRHVPAREIESTTVTAYSPATYGGWHWGVNRTLGGNTAYRLRGNHGVEIVLDDGRNLFVGSQSPSELASAIKQAVESG